MTRPDIVAAVRTVAKFCENPGEGHWKAAMKILQYLLRTKDEGPTYGGRKAGGAKLNWDRATCLDTGRLVSGGVVILKGVAINWFHELRK